VPSAAELRELDDDELENRLAEYRRELLNLRFQLATGQLDNVARLGQVRRDIARVLTVLRERDVSEVEADLAATRYVPPPEPARRQARAGAGSADEAAGAPVAEAGAADEADDAAAEDEHDEEEQ